MAHHSRMDYTIIAHQLYQTKKLDREPLGLGHLELAYLLTSMKNQSSFGLSLLDHRCSHCIHCQADFDHLHLYLDHHQQEPRLLLHPCHLDHQINPWR